MLQDQLFATALAAVQEAEAFARNCTDAKAVTALLTKTTLDQATNVVSAWRDLLPQLITK